MASQSAQLFLSVSCGLLLGVAGCSSPGSRNPGTQASAVEATSFWKPYLLYIQSAPYARLYVEVDAVESMAPDDTSLGRLREFLAAHCDKPHGIEVVRDTVIPRSQARGVAPGELARKYLAGPPPRADSRRAAFMYILCYDTALSRDPGVNGRTTILAQSTPTPDDPHTVLLPYPAMILADPDVNGPRNAPGVAQLSATWLQHEAGHLLGLARDPAHATELHCRKHSCLMSPIFSPTDLLIREVWAVAGDASPMKPLELCASCQAESRDRFQEPGPSNLCFVGPVMVRIESGYQVMALPGRLKVVLGQFEEQDAWDFMCAVHDEPLKPTTGHSQTWCSWTVKPDAREDRARYRETVRRARHDPLDLVRRVAAKL